MRWQRAWGIIVKVLMLGRKMICIGAAAMLVLDGCAHQQKEHSENQLSSRPAPGPGIKATPPHEIAGPASRPSVPVVYSERGFANALSSQQLADVLEKAELWRPKGTTVWFFFVRRHYHPLLSLETYLTVTIYYTPDRSSPRIRKGRFATYNMTWSLGDNPHLDEPQIHGYVQVSPSRQPFGSELQVPAPAYRPFVVGRNFGGAPVSIRDEQVIQLVDFVRAFLAGENSNGDPESLESWRRAAAKDPILNIAVQGDSFELMLGWSGGMFDGRGHHLKVVKKAGSLRVVGPVSMWVS